MKQFHKSIGQSLMTVLMTSTVLEVHMLPIFGASNPQLSPSPSVDTQSPGASTDSPPIEAAVEVSTPETIASPSPTDPAPAANSPEVSPEAAVPETVPETMPETVPTATPEVLPEVVPEAVPEVVPEAVPETVPESAPETVRKAVGAETQPPPTETPGRNPAGEATKTVRQSPESAANSARLTAARQAVSARLAALVNRDRLSKEAQLQQNLVALALYYAQLGKFEDARQVARHPALSLEVQVATLAEIEKLVAQAPGQPGQPPGQPGQPGQPLATATNSASPVNLPENAVNGTTPIPVPIANGFPEGGYLTVPSTPELLQPYMSDRCLNSSSPSASGSLPTPGDMSSKSTAVQPKRSSPFLPVGQQIAARLSADQVLATQAVKPTPKQTQPISITRTVKVSRVAPIAPKPQPDQDLRSQASQPQAIQLPAIQPAASAEILSSAVGGDRMKTVAEVKAEVKNVVGLTIALPSEVPQTLQSIFEGWYSPASPASPASSLPNADAGAQFKLNQSSLPQLIKLSRGATKLSASPQINQSNKSVTVSQTVNLASSPTSGYWRTIAANCGGLQAAGGLSGSNRLLDSGMIFPLPIPVPLTSGFGWRIHPIQGNQRFHSGIDLGAPFGTPVLSALAGRVVAAEEMGGYGLAVIVEASSVQQQNLYAHLSAIAVKPGDRVEQGSVLGLVGSTGSSTGPHLHFETLLPSTEGWTAVDPLGAAMAAAVATPVAQVSQK